MKIYLALRAEGFTETENVKKLLYEISEKGSHHQLLTAGYFTANPDNERLEHEFSGKILEKHSSETDTMAVFLPYFMSDAKQTVSGSFSGLVNEDMDCSKRIPFAGERYFENTAQAEKFYTILDRMQEGMKGKVVEISPCISHGTRLSLKNTTLFTVWRALQAILTTTKKIDRVCEMLSGLDISDRRGRGTFRNGKPSHF